MQDKPSEYIRLIQEDPSLVQVTHSGDENTIFHWAAHYGRLQVMEAIINIDPHMKDRVNAYNRTPSMKASMNDQVACVKLLLDHDADVNIKSVGGKTALDYARKQEIYDMIKKK